MKTACRSLALIAFLGLVSIFVLFIFPTPVAALDAIRDAFSDGSLERAEELAASTAVLVVWGFLAWGVLLIAVVGATALPGVVGRTAHRVTAWSAPRAMRHAVAVLLGVSIATGMVAPSVAVADEAAPPSAAPVSSSSHVLTPDWPVDGDAPQETPVNPSDPVQPAESDSEADSKTPESKPETSKPHTPPSNENEVDTPRNAVSVEEGDTLWSITADHLGDNATDAQIAAEWPKWWSANREVIGEDPDVLQPGQALKPPE